MPHSQGLSNTPYHDPNQPIPHTDIYSLMPILILSSHICLRPDTHQSRAGPGKAMRRQAEQNLPAFALKLIRSQFKLN